MPSACVNFDNLHAVRKDAFRRHVIALSASRMRQAGRTLAAATGC